MNAEIASKVVFVVDVRSFDINCAHLVSEPSSCVKMVKTKHRGRAFAVPATMCHDTLDEAKSSLLEYIEGRAASVSELAYDADNFWVA
jgi:hypothetical protein